MPSLQRGHTSNYLAIFLSAILFVGALFACPLPALAVSDFESGTLDSGAESNGVDAMFFIAELIDNTVKPDCEQEVKQNLAGYSSKITVENALVDPENTVPGGKIEKFDDNGVADYISVFPTNEEIEAACPEFDPERNAVLWYVVKFEPGDGWHVDGLLLDKSAIDEGETNGNGPDEGETNGNGPDEGETNGNGPDEVETNPGSNVDEPSPIPVPSPSIDAKPSSAQIDSTPHSTSPYRSNTDAANYAAPDEESTIPAITNVPDPAATEDTSSATNDDDATSTNNLAISLDASPDSATTKSAETVGHNFPDRLATTMRLTGAAGMVALAAAVLVAAIASAVKSASAKAFENRLKSGTTNRGGRR